MRHKNYFLLLCLLSMLLTACAYKMVQVQAVDGITFSIRKYKSYKKQEKYNNKMDFQCFYKRMFFDKYKGPITKDTMKDFTLCRFDSDSIFIYKNYKASVKLFTTGLISPEILKSAKDSLSIIYNQLDTNKITSTSSLKPNSLKAMEIQAEKRMGVAHFEELIYIEKKPTVRIFKISMSITYYNPYPFDCVYYFEITNHNATRHTDLDTFIQGASLTFLKCASMGQEI